MTNIPDYQKEQLEQLSKEELWDLCYKDPRASYFCTLIPCEKLSKEAMIQFLLTGDVLLVQDLSISARMMLDPTWLGYM